MGNIYETFHSTSRRVAAPEPAKPHAGSCERRSKIDPPWRSKTDPPYCSVFLNEQTHMLRLALASASPQRTCTTVKSLRQITACEMVGNPRSAPCQTSLKWALTLLPAPTASEVGSPWPQGPFFPLSDVRFPNLARKSCWFALVLWVSLSGVAELSNSRTRYSFSLYPPLLLHFPCLATGLPADLVI